MPEAKKLLNERQIKLVLEKVFTVINRNLYEIDEEQDRLRKALDKTICSGNEYKTLLNRAKRLGAKIVVSVSILDGNKEYWKLLDKKRALRDIKLDAEIALNGIDYSEINSIMADLSKKIAAII